MKMNILVFSPYDSMRTLFLGLMKDHQGLSIDFFNGTYAEYLEHGANLNFYQYDFIFARGYTAQMLKKSSAIPVIEIKISLYDMLRAIATARLQSEAFAIMASANITETAKQIIGILQYNNILICEIENEKDAEAYIADLPKQGIHQIVGDVYAINAAKHYNMSAILITSSRASIDDAFQDALTAQQQMSLLYDRNHLSTEIIRNIPTSLLVYNTNGSLILSQINHVDLSQSKLERLVIKHLDTLKEAGEPIYFAAKLDHYILHVKGALLGNENSHFAFYISTSEAPDISLKQSLQVSYPSEECTQRIIERSYVLPPHLLHSDILNNGKKSPNIIIGDLSTGKELLAEYLWVTGRYKNIPLIKLDCSTLSLNTIKQLINSPESPLYEPKYVLLLKDLHLLSLEGQQYLCQFLENASFVNHNLLIVTMTASPVSLLTQNIITSRLCDYLIGNHIQIANLNQRPSDMNNLVNTLINKYNVELGREVVGIMPDALHALKIFPWTSNINQLKSVVRQLVTITMHHYISLEEVETVLDMVDNSETRIKCFDINGTLEDIEQRIIAQILEEESMNYSAVAKRLGISRSTLYRKIKKRI